MKIFNNVLNFILPPRCPICQIIVDRMCCLCPTCWNKFSFLSNPFCDVCAYPFAIYDMQKTICEKCSSNMPSFDKTRSSMIYDEHSKDLILLFKYCDATYLASLFAKFMVYAGSDILSNTDYIVPVPLHWRRLLLRKYNQSSLLAKKIAQQSKKVALLNLLKRTNYNRTQEGLNSVERKKNVKNVFTVNNKYQNQIKGKVITIVDDVIASGATVGECARILKQYGAKQVNILTIGRVEKI